MSTDGEMIRERPVRVMVVVLSLAREPWQSLEKVQRSTWVAPSDDVSYVWLQGQTNGVGRLVFLLIRRMMERLGRRSWIDHAHGWLSERRRVSQVGDLVRTKTFEYWIGTSAKMRAALPFLVEEHDFDYLVRTNSSTYLHIPSLLAHLKGAPRHLYYAGADQGQAHAQGTCIILSRDVIEEMASERRWDYHEGDDVAIGRSAERIGVSFTPLPQRVIATTEAIGEATQWLGEDRFIFRFKNRGRRDADAEMMSLLHRIVLGSKLESEEDDEPSR